MKFLNANKKNFSKKLELILNSRRQNQQIETAVVKKILLDVKKNGDKAVLNYERRFSKIKTRSKKIKFTKSEINQITKNILWVHIF